MEAFKNRRRTTVVICLLLAIIIPLVVLFSRRGNTHGYKSNFILPLYIYPSERAWDPLYDAIITHPRTKFTVIINPYNGPGKTPQPEEEYAAAIQRLDKFPNVKRLGYVRTTYGTRNISNIISDISTYAGWTTTGLGMHGIFFDEAPANFEDGLDDYVKRINQAVKTAPGLLPERITVHNAGRVPDRRLADPNTDVSVVFEGPYSSYQSRSAILASLPLDRTRYSYIIHGVPTSKKSGELRKFVNGLSTHAQYLFVTDLKDKYYEAFGPRLSDYVGAIPT
ncbi:spherulin 4-like cell surface protein [Tothia fuscella]|uniref:Spherulin 4-like cell surface protein n=1 Tax=Tothia fuscella TaxID=1048955 RepID=A0A9P4U4M0_9PEZI|nr:spherulin 4-like cell surface protein [Tothia fuscella]